MTYPQPLDLCQKPTPLEPLRRLQQLLGGPALMVKRDDCTGLALGGNKVRKLDYLFAEAFAQGAKAVVTSGAIQSNHVRQTAAAAARLGVECHVVLERRIASPDSTYHTSGNILLDHLFGAVVHIAESPKDLLPRIASVIARLAERSMPAYVIPSGGSNELGAMGYVDCAAELVAQQQRQGCGLDNLVHATNSGGTQAGLMAGLRQGGSEARVLGVSVRQPKATQAAMVAALAGKVSGRIGTEANFTETTMVDDRFVGPGYGYADAATWDAVRRVAEYEGLLLDPVYTGKAMACLIALIRSDHFSSRSTVVFIHTGGLPGLFAYGDELNRLLPIGPELRPVSPAAAGT